MEARAADEQVPEPAADADGRGRWRTGATSCCASRRGGAAAAGARALELRGDSLLAVEQLEAARRCSRRMSTWSWSWRRRQIALRRFDAAERELRRALKFQPDIRPCTWRWA
jgi:ornithine cyclodeaminase/alanine dehydrogenase-like protein (mu-crystallin family)